MGRSFKVAANRSALHKWSLAQGTASCCGRKRKFEATPAGDLYKRQAVVSRIRRLVIAAAPVGVSQSLPLSFSSSHKGESEETGKTLVDVCNTSKVDEEPIAEGSQASSPHKGEHVERDDPGSSNSVDKTGNSNDNDGELLQGDIKALREKVSRLKAKKREYFLELKVLLREERERHKREAEMATASQTISGSISHETEAAPLSNNPSGGAKSWGHERDGKDWHSRPRLGSRHYTR